MKVKNKATMVEISNIAEKLPQGGQSKKRKCMESRSGVKVKVKESTKNAASEISTKVHKNCTSATQPLPC